MKKKSKKQKAPEIDVLSHRLINEMKVLPQGEKTKLFNKFGIDEGKLPRILQKDPAVVALKAAPGDVIRITRDDGTGKYTTFKVVEA